MTSADDPLLSIEFSARIWAPIDATIDNTVSLTAVDGPPLAAQTGRAIREVGWEQVPWVDGQWPAMDRLIKITLSRSQWDFARGELVGHQSSLRRIGDAESLRLSEDAVSVLDGHLHEADG